MQNAQRTPVAEAIGPSPAVTFVVIAFNERAGIERTIASILDQRCDASVKVLVVDDGSADGTASIVADHADRDPRVRLIALGENRGRGFARRVGVTSADTDVIATVDADIVLPPHWLQTCLDALCRADAVGGTAVPDGDAVYVSRRLRLRPRTVGHTVAVTGSNALYRRSVFDVVGFDGRLRDGEDVALNHELDRAGLRIETVPGLFVRHDEVKSLAETLRWMFQSGRGASRQLKTFGEPRLPDLVFLGFLVAAAAGAVGGRRRPLLRSAVPTLYVTSAAGAHVLRSFRVSLREAPALAGAVGIDAAQILFYLLGRLVGVVRDTAPS